ncbi:isoform b [Ceraceosorus bombacis]|uniref:Isoform b n=1 Tax=Ceraceosorus bombacis TaxID=401625 RepID=A0A0P1BM91_9BASI|nr:isoform b [Ceraceosorus bombacis]
MRLPSLDEASSIPSLSVYSHLTDHASLRIGASILVSEARQALDAPHYLCEELGLLMDPHNEQDAPSATGDAPRLHENQGPMNLAGASQSEGKAEACVSLGRDSSSDVASATTLVGLKMDTAKLSDSSGQAGALRSSSGVSASSASAPERDLLSDATSAKLSAAAAADSDAQREEDGPSVNVGQIDGKSADAQQDLDCEDVAASLMRLASVLKATEVPKMAFSFYEAVDQPRATPEERVADETKASSSTIASQQVLGVVSNVESGREEAAILIVKPRQSDSSRGVVTAAIPIRSSLRFGSTAVSAKEPRLPSFEQVLAAEAEHAATSEEKEQRNTGEDMFVISCDGHWCAGTTHDRRSLTDLKKILPDLCSTPKASRGAHNSHAWLARYIGDDETSISTPLFSRFTTSAFVSPARPVSPKEGEIKLLLGTFNVAGIAPSGTTTFREELRKWLSSSTCRNCEIVVVALQEAEISNTGYFYATPGLREAWGDELLLAVKGKNENYIEFVSRQLVGMILYVFVTPDVVPRVRDVTSDAVGVGLGGWVANKGAVSVRLTVDQTSLCFVGAHLPAMQNPQALQNRRWAVREIFRRCKFELPMPGLADTEENDDPCPLHIEDHDHVFFLGDLNFRIELGIGEVKRLIRKGSSSLSRSHQTAALATYTRPLPFDTLLSFDELSNEIRSGSCFAEFKEGAIAFPPTFKFDVGTDDYDTSEKQRVPAWTDRILWRSRKPLRNDGPASKGAERDSVDRGKEFDAVRLIEYTSVPQVCTSDHKPVRGCFLLRL